MLYHEGVPFRIPGTACSWLFPLPFCYNPPCFFYLLPADLKQMGPPLCAVVLLKVSSWLIESFSCLGHHCALAPRVDPGLCKVPWDNCIISALYDNRIPLFTNHVVLSPSSHTPSFTGRIPLTQHQTDTHTLFHWSKDFQHTHTHTVPYTLLVHLEFVHCVCL